LEETDCTACELHKTRQKIVWGSGPNNPKFLFIGQAPGKSENMAGRPFVGRSGHLLDRLLRKLEIPKDCVYLTNVLKCYPPDDAAPTRDQIEACWPHLERQMRALNCRRIVAVGGTAMVTLARYLGFVMPKNGIIRSAGQWLQHNDTYVFGIIHPAFALRNEEERWNLEYQLKKMWRTAALLEG